MLYAGIAIIVAGIVAALSPLVREWYESRQRRQQRQQRGKDRGQ
jgi:hypothetical protein